MKKILISLLFFSYVTTQAQNLDFLESNVDLRQLLKENVEFDDDSTEFGKVFLKLYQRAMDSDDGTAFYFLSNEFRRGKNVPSDDLIAIECLKKAALEKNFAAVTELANFYREGRNVPKNYKHAFELYRVGYVMGSRRCAGLLGYLSCKGFGTSQDYKKGYEYACIGAENGDFFSKHLKAYCLEKGQGTEKNVVLAKSLYEELASFNFQQSIVRLHKLIGEEQNLKSAEVRVELYPGTLSSFVRNSLNEFDIKNSVADHQPSNISGRWEGRLLVYDWAIQEIDEEYPMVLNLVDRNDSIHGNWKCGKANTAPFTGLRKGNEIEIDSVKVMWTGALGIDDEVHVKKGSFKLVVEDSLTYLVGGLELYNNTINEPYRPVKFVVEQANSLMEETPGNELQLDSLEIIADLDPSENFSEPTKNNLKKENGEVENVKIFPNPTSDMLNIRYYLNEKNNLSIHIYNQSGQVVQTIINNQTRPKGYNAHVVNLSSLSSATYLIIIKSATSKTSFKLIKN